MDSSNLAWAIVQSPPIPLILNGGLILLLIALSPSFLSLHYYNPHHTSISSHSTHPNTLHCCVQFDTISSFYTLILFTLTLFIPSITSYHTSYSRNTHNTSYLTTTSHHILSHCGHDEGSIRAICDSISLYRTIQPSVENERNRRRMNNSSHEVRWIHLEYRISYFLLYTDCIS